LFFAFAGKDFREYIPPNETLENWTRLASIRTVKNCDDPEKYAESMDLLLTKENPLAHSAILYHPKKHIAIIDFITWPRNVSYAEFNIFRIEKNGPNGLIAYQYAVREYKDKKKFMLALKDLREQTKTEMIDRGLVLYKPQSHTIEASSRSRQLQR
jgi:hypothetical protein